jgi:putative ATP-dependent endonuclease of OLD family
MSEIRLQKISIKNYRSFGNEQVFEFPDKNYKRPISIIGYNNSGKTNLMNSILYGIGEKFINTNTFEKTDLHKLDFQNQITIKTKIEASNYEVWSDYYSKIVDKTIGGVHTITTKLEDKELSAKVEPSFFGANKHYNIFYINFHNVKEEISTKKTSWGNLTSFLAKHIKDIVDSDATMLSKKEDFKTSTKISTETVLENSSLSAFIAKIKENYSKNLRNNNCEVEFGLPDYEDIFLQMVFKIGLNGESNNLIPIDHFGDGYISMFVMAVIQAIAESNIDDKCLFLFEEPESFLHENHQEYFYKMVLCTLADKGHQVIYTTHSDKMIDIFNTKSIIRIDFDETDKRTIKKYNNVNDFNVEDKEIISIENFNSFIKSVEPNINKYYSVEKFFW